MNIRYFISYFLVFTGLLIGIIVFLGQILPGVNLFVPKFWVLFGFMAGITFTAYVMAYLGIKRNPEAGVMAVMASVAVKMMFCMAFVLIYRLKSNSGGLTFVLNFFSLYLFYTAFEIYCLLRNLRHQNLK